MPPDRPSLPRPRSIARRLFIGAVIWSVVALTSVALVLGAIYRAQLVERLDSELDSTLIQLTRALDSVEVETGGEVIRDGRVSTVDSLFPSDPRFNIQLSGWYWAVVAVEADGTLGADVRPESLWDGEVPLDRTLLPTALTRTGITFYGESVGPADEPVRVAMKAIRFENRAEPVLLVAARDITATDSSADRFQLLLIVAMSVLAGGILLAMWLQVRFGLAPLREISAHLGAIREGRRDKLDEDYPTEVQPLTSEINKLLDHNREIVSRAQTHVGNLAHALKTPIAVLMNEAKGSSQLADVVRRQAEAMSSNVQHYLKRAQAAARAEVLGARCDIAPVFSDLSRLLTRLYKDKGVVISTDVADGAVFRGERQDLEEIMGNLMENACKWARSKVRASAVVTEGQLVIAVEDDGPGLTPEERKVALKRGGRLDEMTPGTGLGLSIVAELVEMHSGQFALKDSPEGGLRAEMTFRAV